MRDGFIKVAVGTPDVLPANCEANRDAILRCIADAEKHQAALLVLPELCLTGYTCGDLFLQRQLQDASEAALQSIAEQSKKSDMLIAIGLPFSYRSKLYNVAAVLQKGKVLGLIPKSYLPNYGEFYESRQFASALDLGEGRSIDAFGQENIPFGTKLLFASQEMQDFILAFEICEDLWVPSPPSNSHAVAGALAIANLSASDELVGKESYRRDLVSSQSSRLVCAYVYADAGWGESSTDLVFSAHNIIAENGAILAESPRFENDIIYSEIDVEKLANERRRLRTYPSLCDDGYRVIPFSQKLRETKLTRTISAHPFLPSDPRKRAETCENILQIQSQALAKRLAHTQAKSLLLGLSGGLDSTLALLVAKRAMQRLNRPNSDIHAVTMPCFGTTKRTLSNAELLSQALDLNFSTIDITAAVRQHFADIGQDESVHDVTFENCQARERTQVLMDLANKENGMVLGTGDLSELALGWATYNGDHMSMYAVNASVPKTLVRYLVAHEAEQTEDPILRKTLQDILDTPVSPELLPPKDGEISQKTEELVGPYELHDFFLYYVVRWNFPPAKVVRMAEYAFQGQYDRATILIWCQTFYRRFFSQQFKRSCLPDGPKVGTVSLSPRSDWRMPSDASAALWLAYFQNE